MNNQGMKFSSRQAGFSLVEIAVVLVIIGLLIGGILQGTEMIDNSRIKKAQTSMQAVSTAVVAYQDRYQRMPGDDGPTNTLLARGGDWVAPITGGNNDGNLNVPLNNTFNGQQDGARFWQHLRAAGYISGNPTLAGANAMPRNAFGGLTGVTSANSHGGLTGPKVCMSQVPGKAAAAMDLSMDDGSPQTGDFRGNQTNGNNVNPNNNAAAAYDEGLQYTVCRRI